MAPQGRDAARSQRFAGQRLMYSVEEASELLGLSRAHVYRLIDLEQLGSVRIGKCRRITADQLVAFVRDKESQAGFDWRNG